jgi:hypothetical protein
VVRVTDSHVKDVVTSTEGEAMPDAQDTRGSVARVLHFLVERFPPAPQLVLMAVLFVAATLMSGVLLPESLTGTLGDVDPLKAIAGFVGSLLFIVRLRVYDDVKDADTDRIENPTRPIPRGLVSIRELDVAGVVILLVEPLVIAAMLAATSIGIGFEWGRKFERYFATHKDRAWALWMLWPSAGAIGFTALVRDTYPTWSVLALVVVTMLTIVGHALVMTQRDRTGTVVPTGKLRDVVEAVPGAAGLFVYLVLAVAGVTELIA